MTEQQKNGKILMQLVVLTNELNERDNQIAMLKKKETHYGQTLQERENLFKQDTMVRMQLGKRLEQVLMDKEEALDQLDALRVRTMCFSLTVILFMVSFIFVLFCSATYYQEQLDAIRSTG